MEHQEYYQSRVHQNFIYIKHGQIRNAIWKNVVKLNLKALDTENISMNLAGGNFHIV